MFYKLFKKNESATVYFTSVDVVTVLVLIKINHVFEDLSYLLERLPFSKENSSSSTAFSGALFFILLHC